STGLRGGRQWFLLVDDDVFVANMNLIDFIKEIIQFPLSSSPSSSDPSFPFPPLLVGEECRATLPPEAVYPHPLTTEPIGPLVYRVCGGGGWLFSAALASALLPLLDCCYNYNGIPYSDIFLSLC